LVPFPIAIPTDRGILRSILSAPQTVGCAVPPLSRRDQTYLPAGAVFWLVVLLAVLNAGLCQGVQRQPWSFTAISNQAPPSVLNIRWPQDDLDRFILARLETRKLAPQRDADRYTLLRRVTFDLTGLPPAPAAIAAFVNDPALLKDAFAKVTDRLLKSPRFGERWARHWLDAVRYADSVGRTWNAPFVYSYRYRDYVIDAYNADTPFNQFVRQQLAGDLLPAKDGQSRRKHITATGFLTLGSVKLILPYGDEFRLDRVDDQIDVTTRAFLGLTVSCARCHDHKYDPIAQRDYYALAGVFMSTDTWPGQRNRGGGGPKGYVDQEMALGLPTGGSTTGATAPQRRPTSGFSAPKVSGQMMVPSAPTRTANGQWTGIHAFDANRVMGVSEGRPENCAVRVKGEPYNRGAIVRRGAVNIPGLPGLPAIPAAASGRLQLADWIASTNNPLTARVMVNRVWQHLFGRGIVPTVDDFGSTGERPSHPALLDHLAGRFMENGWSVKQLIRTLILSRTYRMSSDTYPNNTLIDQSNTLFWRMEPRRLEVEAIRDALLQVGGILRLERPPGIQLAGNGGKGRYAKTRSLLTLNSPYRTVYLPILRDLLPEMHEVFDFPNPSQIKGQRDVTTVAPQSLFLLNNELPVRAAGQLARRLLQNPRLRDDTTRLQSAWLATLGRLPEASEIQATLDFMKSLEAGNPADALAYRWTAAIQALLTTTEFRYVR
jgi:hypothetical protein